MSFQDTLRRVSLASVFDKPVEATFDGGILSSGSGVMLFREKSAPSSLLGLSGRYLGVSTSHRLQERRWSD